MKVCGLTRISCTWPSERRAQALGQWLVCHMGRHAGQADKTGRCAYWRTKSVPGGGVNWKLPASSGAFALKAVNAMVDF